MEKLIAKEEKLKWEHPELVRLSNAASGQDAPT